MPNLTEQTDTQTKKSMFQHSYLMIGDFCPPASVSEQTKITYYYLFKKGGVHEMIL